MKRRGTMVGVLRLMSMVGVFAALASTAVAGADRAPARQLTGKVTSVTRTAITVRSPAASLRCGLRAGLAASKFAGKRVTMACSRRGSRLVVSSIRLAAAGKSVQRKRSPAPSAPSSLDDDPADDDDSGEDDDSGDDGPGDDDDADDDCDGTDDDDSGDDSPGDDDCDGDDEDDEDEDDDDDDEDDEDEGDDDDGDEDEDEDD